MEVYILYVKITPRAEIWIQDLKNRWRLHLEVFVYAWVLTYGRFERLHLSFDVIILGAVSKFVVIYILSSPQLYPVDMSGVFLQGMYLGSRDVGVFATATRQLDV